MEVEKDLVTAELEKLVTADRLGKIDKILENRTASLTIVLDEITHFHNVSAVMRSAEAFGLLEIYVLGSRDKISNSEFSSGISLGTEKWLNVNYYNSEVDLLKDLRKKNFKLVALLPPDKYENVIPVSTLPFEEPLALMFGNEVSGLRTSLIDEADIKAFIPMKGFVESFNISVACAITLYSSTIEKSNPADRTIALDSETKATTRAKWIRNSIQNVELIERNISKRLLEGNS